MRSAASESLSPVAAGERIEALDVVRGFALLGIFLMNVEFFNRPMAGIGEGMPVGLTGVDWFASWFIAYFVQGKFWTIFSLLFGMGFAVMLARAERAERPFLRPYLRRILALAVFGAMHCIFLWAGDILYSYASAAGGLLILLYGRWKPILIAMVALIALAFVPGLGAIGQVAGSLAFISLLALYMRSEKRVLRLPLFSFIFLILGVLGALASVALWVVPDAPKDPRLPVTAISGIVLLSAILSARYRGPIELRGLRLGVSVYTVPTLMMISIGTVQYLSPPDPDLAPPIVAKAGPPPAAASEARPVSDAKPAPEAKPAPDDKASAEKAKKRAERAKRLAKQEELKRKEERVLSQGTYADVVEMRARDFPERAVNDTSFAAVAIGMFLIGVWFVRSGVMENTRAHLPLFRKLAWYGLPLGIGIGLVGGLIATSHTPGDTTDGFVLTRGLSMLGSLPACLGYVGLVVVALHSDTVFSKIRVLAPAGRMALTNYLTQSLISTLVFYGYGAGQWGLSRSWQVVYVVAVYALQIAFSHWWLARFRYGPMEWVWRSFTYRQYPEMRLRAPAAPTPAGSV